MCVVLDPCHRGGGSTKREWERTIVKLPSLKESCAEVVKRVVSGESLLTGDSSQSDSAESETSTGTGTEETEIMNFSC